MVITIEQAEVVRETGSLTQLIENRGYFLTSPPKWDSENRTWTCPVQPLSNRAVMYAERGVQKFQFTFEDISKACGLSIRGVKKKKADGKFDPRDFQSVVDFILSYRESNA